MGQITRKERERRIRENEIIEAAKSIFARDGYESASMNEIAKVAEFSKRTLYQYFKDKDDLYLTVALQVYNSILEHLEKFEPTKKTGYEIVQEILEGYYEFYIKNESVFTIIYDIGKVRQRTDNSKVNEFLKADKIIFEMLEENLRKGQEDGSIRKEIDVTSTTRSLIFLVTGFFNQLTITGQSYSKHIQMDTKKFALQTIDLLHSALKS